MDLEKRDMILISTGIGILVILCCICGFWCCYSMNIKINCCGIKCCRVKNKVHFEVNKDGSVVTEVIGSPQTERPLVDTPTEVKQNPQIL